MCCTSLLTGEAFYSDHAVMVGSVTLPAGVNLLDSSLAARLWTGEPGHRVPNPTLRFRKGNNELRYEAKLVFEGKTLLAIQDTLPFHVDSAAGH
jgi:hypothetical protein